MAAKRIFRFILPGILVLSSFLDGRAQEISVQQLENVEITDKRLSDFAVGSSTLVLDTTLLALEPAQALGDIIATYTALHIKSYGNGMLSSISFRGTGPAHTAVLWHGINIAYPMLGQTDFSLLSMALSDKVFIQHGTGTSLYGSGSIGGTISLASVRQPRGITGVISLGMGSFGTMINNLKLGYASNKLSVKVFGFREESANNFRFHNTTKLDRPVEVQENAHYLLYGLGLESTFRINKMNSLELSAQFTAANRNLQQAMNVTSSGDNQLDHNLRLQLAYVFDGLKSDVKLQVAVLDDEIVFNGDKTKVSQQIARLEFGQFLADKIKINLAADINQVDVTARFYRDTTQYERRANLWGALLYTPVDRLVLSASLRKAYHSEYVVPLSPTFGAELAILDKLNDEIKIKTQLAKGFRIPTLNELYWEPGGNLDLVPENNYSAEIGIQGEHDRKTILEYSLTAYKMFVDNWILWRPVGSFWAPENLKKVNVYGIEAGLSLGHDAGRASMKWRANYAMTRSINETAIDQFDRSVGKQLAYVPINKLTLTHDTRVEKWLFRLNLNMVGKRFVSADNESSLPAYQLLNFRVVREIKLNTLLINSQAAVNNILNTSYQSVENRAMPGINIMVGINITFNKPRK